MVKSSRQAFTLLEMVVTVALMTLLTVVGIFGVNSILSAADEEEAELNLETVLISQIRFATTYGSFTPNPADLDTVESETTSGLYAVAGSSLFIQASPLNPYDADFRPGTISMAVSDEGALGLATLSSGECVGIQVPPPNVSGVPVSLRLADGAVCEGRSMLPDGEFAVASSDSYRW